ncbi:MAG: hypothetical protein ACRDRO_04165 [Pseudonocardiaceae bacterium]
MTAPEPPTLADRVARARWDQRMVPERWMAWDQLPADKREFERRAAADLLAAIEAAGLAVVELPETILREEWINGIGLEVEVPTPGERSWEITGWHFPRL